MRTKGGGGKILLKKSLRLSSKRVNHESSLRENRNENSDFVLVAPFEAKVHKSHRNFIKFSRPYKYIYAFV
jgi:hypothetical protein